MRRYAQFYDSTRDLDDRWRVIFTDDGEIWFAADVNKREATEMLVAKLNTESVPS
jgi:hypothetical protein